MAVTKVFGIAGVTNGGKTTLSQMLLKRLQLHNVNVTHMNMDDYYWDENDSRHVQLEEFNNQYANWDDVCAVDWKRLLGDIVQWKKQAVCKSDGDNILLVEGILIFNNRELLQHFDHKYFITLPEEECARRRKTRHYLPPEPEGYFEKIAWPYYLKFKEELDNYADIVFLDGTKPVDVLFKRLLADVATFSANV